METLDRSVTYGGSNFVYSPSKTEKYNCFDYYQHYYWYPMYIPQTYVLNEDKGKKSLEVLKTLMDEKVITIKTVKQFCELMDRLIKIL